MVLNLEEHVLKARSAGQSLLEAQLVLAIKRIGNTLSVPEEGQLLRAYLEVRPTPTTAAAAATARPS